MATRFVGEVLFGNFSTTKDMMTTIEDERQKDRIFQIFNKTMDIFEFISLYNFMIIFIFELQKTEGHNNRFLAASRFPALQLHGIQGPVMDGCKLQDLKASRRCLWCPGCRWGAWMSRWKLGSMVKINGLFHLLINGVLLGVITHLLTIDPKFLVHPSGCLGDGFLGMKC